jgi:hypothetical protein
MATQSILDMRLNLTEPNGSKSVMSNEEFKYDGCPIHSGVTCSCDLTVREDVAKQDRMLKWFVYGHLPLPLCEISMHFHDLAYRVVCDIPPGPERTVALRKLLEAKDAAVRARLHPGG